MESNTSSEPQGQWVAVGTTVPSVAYDRLAESRRMIAEGVPEMPLKLTRRRRFIPVAFDVDGDVAATLFLRRGVSGNPSLEAWALEHRDGDWEVLGGGSGDGYDHLFEPRESIDELFVSCGSGWTARSAGRFIPGFRGISHAEMRLGPPVAALGVADRIIEVQSHGIAIVVWSTRRRPTIMALTAESESLGEISLRH